MDNSATEMIAAIVANDSVTAEHGIFSRSMCVCARVFYICFLARRVSMS